MGDLASLSGLKVIMLLDNTFTSDARVEKEAKTLVDSGVELTILCTEDTQLKKVETRNGYTISRIIPDGYNAPLRRNYKTYLETVVNEILTLDFHVIHCHDFYMLSIGAEVKKRRPKVKLIYDAHEYLRGWPFYKTSEGINKWKGKLVWKKLIRKEKKEILAADKVITITNGIAKQFQLNCGLKTLPHVIGNHPHKFDLSIREGYFHTKYGIPPNIKILIHTGTIYHTDDQLQHLFEIIEKNSNIVLVFIGNRPKFYEVEEAANKKGILNKTLFFHPYPNNQKEVINLLAAADIGLLHIIDKWEAHRIGFSNRFVEYIMAGIPVIATPQEFTKEINNTYCCSEFYQADRSVELSKAIKIMISNYDVYKSEAVKARSALDWNLESEKLVNLYQAILK